MAVVEYRVVDQVAVITLNRPEKRNAINPEMTLAIEAAVDRLEQDPDVLVGILTAAVGEGGRAVFCAGNDLSMARVLDDGTFIEDEGSHTERGGFGGLTARVREKPLIASVDGLATAGGCELVLACDTVIASERAAFALPEVRWNLLAGAGGLFRLPRVVGRQVAMDIALTATELSAERAYQLGLVSRLVPSADLESATMEFARQICANPPQAVRLTRTIVAAAEYANDDLAWQMCADAGAVVLASPDTPAAVRRFTDRAREPKS